MKTIISIKQKFAIIKQNHFVQKILIFYIKFNGFSKLSFLTVTRLPGISLQKMTSGSYKREKK
jgi:hypothetical protein